MANYLNSLKFRQDHTLADVRLALGYGAFALAAACFAWDYYLGFEATKLWSAGAVAGYSLLNAALWFWQTRVEQGTIYAGEAPPSSSGSSGNGGSDRLYIASLSKKADTTYYLKVAVVDAATGSQKAFALGKPFAEFFDASGYFVAAPFQSWLASNIGLVARADPKRVKSDTEKMLETTPELLVALEEEEQQAQATGAEAAEGGKRRKA